MKKILIPIKASEELPETNKLVHGLWNNEPCLWEIKIVDGEKAIRIEYLGLKRFDQFVNKMIWYKEVDEAEYLREFMYFLEDYTEEAIYSQKEQLLTEYLNQK